MDMGSHPLVVITHRLKGERSKGCSRLCHVAKRSELLGAEPSVISDHTLRLPRKYQLDLGRRSDNVGGETDYERKVKIRASAFTARAQKFGDKT